MVIFFSFRLSIKAWTEGILLTNSFSEIRIDISEKTKSFSRNNDLFPELIIFLLEVPKDSSTQAFSNSTI